MQDNQAKRSAVADDSITQTTAASPSPARSGASRTDGGGDGEVAMGTPSSNTVPSNDNTAKFKALRFGVDSLYLSYHGQLADDWNIKLDDLKTS